MSDKKKTKKIHPYVKVTKLIAELHKLIANNSFCYSEVEELCNRLSHCQCELARKEHF